MNITVVIPTLHACDQLLNQLLADLPADVEVIVEDDGSFAENVNRGVQKATHEIVVALNDDISVIPGYEQWLLPLIDPIVRDPTVAITGAKLLYPDLTIQHAGVYLTIEDGLLTARNMIWNTASGPVQAVTGACMAIRRSVFEALGGFDDQFVNGYEDVDLCLQARAAGHQVIYVAEAVLVHHESQSGAARWAHTGANIHRLQTKWVGDAQAETVADSSSAGTR